MLSPKVIDPGPLRMNSIDESFDCFYFDEIKEMIFIDASPRCCCTKHRPHPLRQFQIVDTFHVWASHPWKSRDTSCPCYIQNDLFILHKEQIPAAQFPAEEAGGIIWHSFTIGNSMIEDATCETVPWRPHLSLSGVLFWWISCPSGLRRCSRSPCGATLCWSCGESVVGTSVMRSRAANPTSWT